MQTDRKPLYDLAHDWRSLLFPQANDEQFADGYAQAVTFGLLMAKFRGLSLADGVDDGARELSRMRLELERTLTLVKQHNPRVDATAT